MQNTCPRSREFNDVTVGHLVWWFPAKLAEFSKIVGGVFESSVGILFSGKAPFRIT